MTLDNPRTNWDLRKGESMLQAMIHARLPLCITDPNLPHNPIVFANLAFTELTGYESDEVIGRNCRFLQGKDTTPESVAAIRKIIEGQTVDTVEVLNYRKDGSTFLNALQLGPILDDNGGLIFFFGSQLDVSAKRDVEREARQLADRELLHRLRNIMNVMSAIIRMTAREEDSAATLSQKVIGRLEALSKVHFETIDRPVHEAPEIRKLAEALLVAYAPFGPDQIHLSGPDHLLPAQLISPITLLLHELATNAVKHGALSCPTGEIDLGWSVHPSVDGTTIRLRWKERNGPEVLPPDKQGGSSIMQNLVAASGGSLDFDWRQDGLVVNATFIA